MVSQFQPQLPLVTEVDVTSGNKPFPSFKVMAIITVTKTLAKTSSFCLSAWVTGVHTLIRSQP